jgi:pyruvate,water dikinase
MKRRAAIVTNRGGRPATPRSSPASSASRRSSAAATRPTLKEARCHVRCSEGDTGFVYDGLLETEITHVQSGEMPPSP